MSEFSPQIVDHFMNPRNCGELDNPQAVAIIRNAACGDQLHLFAQVQGDRVVECRYLAYGCAASMAIGSILTEEAKGRTLDDLAALKEENIVALSGGLSPSQMHCATIGRDALVSLVENYRAGGPSAIRPPSSPCCPV